MPSKDWPLRTEYGAETSRTLLMRVREPEDGDAWADFVNRYAPKIFNWCRRYGLQDDDAADVTQDVLVKLVRKMRDFEYTPSRGSFRGWLKTVTANTVRDLADTWKKPGRGSGDTAVGTMLATVEDPDAVDALSAEIEAGYKQEILAQATSQIKSRVKHHTWQAYEATAIQGLSANEAAKKLNIPVSDVYVAKSRVIKMLREYVAQAMGDEE